MRLVSRAYGHASRQNGLSETLSIFKTSEIMKEAYAQLHRNMIAEIDDCLNQDMPEKRKSENCFHIALSYGRQLKELMYSKSFEDDDEEIDFFRNVKPQFSCYIEYYRAISSALFFVPATKEEAIVFWKNEKKRLQQFIRMYEAFIAYYESDRHSSDKLYFLRESNDLKFVPNLNIYDTDIDWCTSHDRLVRNFLAYKMYGEYCDRKLSEMILV